RTRGSGFGTEVKRRIMLGTYALSAGYYDAYYVKAQQVRTLIKGEFDAVLETVDAILAPTSPTVAFKIGAKVDDPLAMYLNDACTLPVNIAGLPGVSVPCGLSDGLPVGLQVIGRAFDEATILRVADAYQRVAGFADLRAPTAHA
ncbi:MAG: amidase family protein, partial [Candidatus Limnocylindria bacterium]